MSRKKPSNPFYVLLIVVGCAFAVTACAYFVMTTMARDATTWQEADASGPLMTLMDQYGFLLMVVELVVLAILTFAAIATDEYWARKAVSAQDAEVDSNSTEAQKPTGS